MVSGLITSTGLRLWFLTASARRSQSFSVWFRSTLGREHQDSAMWVKNFALERKSWFSSGSRFSRRKPDVRLLSHASSFATATAASIRSLFSDFTSKCASKNSVRNPISLFSLPMMTLCMETVTLGMYFFFLFLGPPEAKLSPLSWIVIRLILYSIPVSSSSAVGSCSSCWSWYGASTGSAGGLKSGFFKWQPKDSPCKGLLEEFHSCCILIASSMFFSFVIASNASVCSFASLQITTNLLSGRREARPRLWTSARKVRALSKRTTRLHTGTSRPSSSTLVLTSTLTSPERNFFNTSSCSPLQSIPSLACPWPTRKAGLRWARILASCLIRSPSLYAVFRIFTKTIALDVSSSWTLRMKFWSSLTRYWYLSLNVNRLEMRLRSLIDNSSVFNWFKEPMSFFFSFSIGEVAVCICLMQSSMQSTAYSLPRILLISITLSMCMACSPSASPLTRLWSPWQRSISLRMAPR